MLEAGAVNGARAVAVAGQEAETPVNGGDGLGRNLDGDALVGDAVVLGALGGRFEGGGFGPEVPEVGDLAEEIKLADVDTLALSFEADLGAFHVVLGLGVAVGKDHEEGRGDCVTATIGRFGEDGDERFFHVWIP